MAHEWKRRCAARSYDEFLKKWLAFLGGMVASAGMPSWLVASGGRWWHVSGAVASAIDFGRGVVRK